MGVRHTSLHVLADKRYPVLHSVHSESMCHRRGQVRVCFKLRSCLMIIIMIIKLSSLNSILTTFKQVAEKSFLCEVHNVKLIMVTLKLTQVLMIL